jgi:hypothetical protein
VFGVGFHCSSSLKRSHDSAWRKAVSAPRQVFKTAHLKLDEIDLKLEKIDLDDEKTNSKLGLFDSVCGKIDSNIKTIHSGFGKNDSKHGMIHFDYETSRSYVETTHLKFEIHCSSCGPRSAFSKRFEQLLEFDDTIFCGRFNAYTRHVKR